MRTDIAIIQPASPALFSGLLGARTIVTDPNYATQTLIRKFLAWLSSGWSGAPTNARLTDGNTAGYKSIFTADEPTNLAWNSNDTMLIVRHVGGVSMLMQFDPKTMLGNLLPGTYNKSCFSCKHPGTLFTLIGTQLFQTTFIQVNGAWTQQSSVMVADFASILPSGFKVNWSGVLMHSLDDNIFYVAFSEGPQDTGYYLCVWHASSLTTKYGYRMLNTETGQVTGDWGQVGTSTSRSWGFTIHDAVMTANYQYGLMTFVGENGPSVWDIKTLNVISGIQGGHHARGFLHYYAGGVGGGQFGEVPYANPTTSRLIVPAANLPKNQVPPQVFTGAQHPGFGKIDRSDKSIFWAGWYDSTPPFTCAYANEITGYDAQTGTVCRACQTYNSGLSKEFDVAHAMIIPSQTGKFVAYSSDMMGGLGSTSGAAQGTLGVDARGDVFVVQVG